MSEKIQDARRVMRDAFAEDGPEPGTFRHAYQSNIAMMIYDRFVDYDLAMSPNSILEECNDVADSIIKVLYESGFEDSDSPDLCYTEQVVGRVRDRAMKVVEAFMFEPNDDVTRDAISGHLNLLLDSMVELDDYTVLVDESNNTEERIAKNELWIDLAIRPKGNIEFIMIPIRIGPTGKTSQDAFDKARPDL